MALDQIEQDQSDWFYRLLSDSYLAEVSVLLAQTGDIEADIEQALAILNERGGKIGACVVVLKPELVPESPDSPGPVSVLKLTMQVIDQPLFNDGDTGTGLSASQISEHIRKDGHHFSTGRGNVYAFAGQVPVPVDPGKNSYAVSFTRRAADCPPRQVATPAIAQDSVTAPAVITLTCATPGAAVYYTVDGSSPFSANAAATLYTVPFNLPAAATVRAAGSLAGYRPSNVAQIVIA